MLEDIDSLFGKDRASKNGKSALSFSGLLNALDGVGAASGQVASPRVPLATLAACADRLCD